MVLCWWPKKLHKHTPNLSSSFWLTCVWSKIVSTYSLPFFHTGAPVRLVDVCMRVIMRTMWFCGGFHWIRVKGECAPPSQAPILAMAPHSTYFDAIPVTRTMCSIVGKLESRSIPVWGSECLQPSNRFRVWRQVFPKQIKWSELPWDDEVKLRFQMAAVSGPTVWPKLFY